MLKSVKFWIGIGALVLILGFLYSTYMSLVNYEENIKASDKIMITSIDTMVKKIEGTGAVVTNLRETITEVLKTYTGEEGRTSGGSFINAVAEAVPEVPADTWNTLAATMNAAYGDFENAQNSKTLRLAEYGKKLRDPKYLVAKGLGGFPTFSLEEMGQLVIGTTARDAQETKQIETVDPFKSNE